MDDFRSKLLILYSRNRANRPGILPLLTGHLHGQLVQVLPHDTWPQRLGTSKVQVVCPCRRGGRCRRPRRPDVSGCHRGSGVRGMPTIGRRGVCALIFSFKFLQHVDMGVPNGSPLHGVCGANYS